MLIALLILSAATQWPSQLVSHPAPVVSQDESYGAGVALDGDTAAVGAPGGAFIPGDGRVYVFAREPAGWATVQTIDHPQPSSLPSMGGAFGAAVDLEGDLLAIGDSAWGGPSGIGGRAWFYRRVGGSFVLEGDTGFFPPAGSALGSEVAVDEQRGRVAVAAASYDPTGTGGIGIGGIWIYEHTGAGWEQVSELIPSSTETTTLFAASMALEGDLLLAGHSQFGPQGEGGVFVFERVNGAWAETGVLGPFAPQGSDQFGSALAFDGTTLLVGLPGRNGLVGSVQAFRRGAGGSFSFEQEVAPTFPEPLMMYGSGLALAGNAALVGAPHADVGEAHDSGLARLLSRQAGTWTDVGRLTDPHPGLNDKLGFQLALDGSRALVGNPFDNWIGVNTGSALFFELLPTGLVYCTAGTSAAGCAAQLTTSGQPSASAPSGFTLAAQDLEGQRDGLFFLGTSGGQAVPWGSGTSFQCVTPPVVRTPLLVGGGTAGSCDGALARDLNALWCPACPSPAKNPGAGAVVQAQLWYRDPGSTSNQTTSLSDAIEFHLAP